ncbi:hypothetical protein C5167_043802 [Papaver somniferum]|uniref:Uncharacterized protein n=1 Tax=Papaver somniferum TaxID=3469 RepID=A0A4Y7L971_PAPSO|nr:hypothetical protein C5167_043802 [Papaver somniferum]
MENRKCICIIELKLYPFESAAMVVEVVMVTVGTSAKMEALGRKDINNNENSLQCVLKGSVKWRWKWQDTGPSKSTADNRG